MLDGVAAGVFEIEGFDKGYFWGSGTSSEPFEVMGSVTPDGNLLLLTALGGAPAQSVTGVLKQETMHLRSYDGTSAFGSAWLIGGSTPSARWLVSSVQGTLAGI